MSQPRSPAELAGIALQVAQGCARIVSAGYRTRPAVGKKGRVDLVTEFDLASEQFLRAELARLTPEMPIIAEERGGIVTDDLCWHCDPLDGTTNFVHGHPFYAVSIGAIERGIPLVGAVVAPELRLTWVGYQGGPSVRNDVGCHVSDTEELDDALFATGFPPDRSDDAKNNFASWARVKRAARGVRRCGSASLDLCLVADGTYDGYWERSLHSWDLAAGAAIVLGAGGKLTDLQGNAPDLSSGNLVATNAKVHAALLQLIQG
jgi:myo-inositol-1(or 4)-monophosphatase